MRPLVLCLFVACRPSPPGDGTAASRPEVSDPSDASVPSESGIQQELEDSLSWEPQRYGEPLDPPDAARRNVVLILSDDQRADSMWAMPLTTERLGSEALSFERAYITTPLCCPARASILAGGRLAQETGVLQNSLPNGGFESFNALHTLGTQLQEAGYQTALIGKYLNGWSASEPWSIPPGWDRFVGLTESSDWHATTWTQGSSGPEEAGIGTSIATTTYMTDYIAEQALDFLNGIPEDAPFLLILTPHAPHDPAEPAEEDAELFRDHLTRGPAFNEEDLSDKPAWLQAFEPLSDEAIAAGDEGAILALQSLQAVDRLVESLIQTLEDSGKWNDTLFIYTSDNGVLDGDHRMYGKAVPYEEAIRVPLLMAAPGVQPRGVERLVAVNLDVPATIAAAADIDLQSDGYSLLGFAQRDPAGWREALYLESWTTGVVPTWSALLTEDWKYVEYTTAEVELYDRLADPAELHSRHDDPSVADVIAVMSAELAPHKGLGLQPTEVRESVGQPIDIQLESWGGSAPFTWAVAESSSLPKGLELSSEGRLHGTMRAAGRSTTRVVLTGSGVEAHGGGPPIVTEPLNFLIDAAPAPMPEVMARRRPEGVFFDLDLPAPGRWSLWIHTEDVSGEARQLGPVDAGPGRVQLQAGPLKPGLLRVRVELNGDSSSPPQRVRIPPRG